MEMKPGTVFIHVKYGPSTKYDGGEVHFFLNIQKGYTTDKLEEWLQGKFVDIHKNFKNVKEESDMLIPYVITGMTYLT